MLLRRGREVGWVDTSTPMGPGQVSDNGQLTARQQIDSIQLHSLGKLIPSSGMSFHHRVASRLEEDFFGQPFHRKIRFLAYGVRWSLRRAVAKVGAASPRGLRSPASATLRVAVDGIGALGDFLTHMLFIQEFYRQFGPMHIDFYCLPEKVRDAKFIFGEARFVKRVVSTDYLSAVEQNYDLV